jgi:hypothetical protein
MKLYLGITAKTIVSNENVNSNYGPTFYNPDIGSKISDSVIVGNSNSQELTSLGPSGLVVAWDRGLLVNNLRFFNFPDSNSHAIRATEIIGRCV